MVAGMKPEDEKDPALNAGWSSEEHIEAGEVGMDGRQKNQQLVALNGLTPEKPPACQRGIRWAGYLPDQDKYWEWLTPCDYSIKDVTHWLPLPRLPGAGE